MNKKIGKKSQNYLFAVNNFKRKGDNDITIGGTKKLKICCLQLVTANKHNFHFLSLLTV